MAEPTIALHFRTSVELSERVAQAAFALGWTKKDVVEACLRAHLPELEMQAQKQSE